MGAGDLQRDRSAAGSVFRKLPRHLAVIAPALSNPQMQPTGRSGANLRAGATPLGRAVKGKLMRARA